MQFSSWFCRPEGIDVHEHVDQFSLYSPTKTTLDLVNILIICPSGPYVDCLIFFSGISLSRVLTKFHLYFQSLLLFTNVIMDSAGIDYHVILAGNLFQQCLDNPGLQQELLCALCKQTSRIMTHSSKHGVQVKKQHSIKHTRVSHYFYLVSSFFCTTYHSLSLVSTGFLPY